MMIDLLILLPLFMIGLLNLTFQVSVDEITDVARKTYFSLRKYEEKLDLVGIDQFPDKPVKCHCDCRATVDESKELRRENLWNPSSIEDIICPDDSPKICPHGYYFHGSFCRCVPINGEHQTSQNRRRPPV
ncbi:hypothetical protein JTE90_015514 [Oedothorax gibbosus]|uniref:Uncharacterized protein n=1 Tax=Oedothorax gibbosus TaxID=931172 RepID=A0AAV6VPY5_9ARAC|nr:hypothetical protein JTE90_015514 [Oedothorax gibbosus]